MLTLRRLLATPGFASIAVATIAAIIVASGYFLLHNPAKKMLHYCAVMPDAVGLYVGNQVTERGIAVGSVTGIRPEGRSVRVEFEMDANYPLTGDVSAATVSDTVVADRGLAVLADRAAHTRWNPDRCITKTATPKTVTETLDALTTLTTELGDGSQAAGLQHIRDAIAAIGTATSGTGPKLNELIKQLAGALSAPDTAIGHIGSLVDDLNSLSSSISGNWDDIAVMLRQFAPVLNLFNSLWSQIVSIGDSIATIIPWVNDITTTYGGAILDGLDAAIPYLRLLGANVGTLEQIIATIPPLVSAFEQSIDPHTGRITLAIAPSKTALPQQDADRICAAANALTTGRCPNPANGLTGIDVVPLVLGPVGAR
ncbi:MULTISPECIES: MlaD family protein [unclassified Nocardia]|uniref:MlaD family protein n=1 Tax=unclassified Nocardia TaxID=2637762 RepID=UPI001CE45165|nr:MULTISPECIES: MlaD family protein [unclassified Nocardia]